MEACSSFAMFLDRNGLDPLLYQKCSVIPRYIRYARINPRTPNVTLEDLRSQLGADVNQVGWLPGFYSMPDSVGLAGCTLYKEGRIYGVDAASGAAVRALSPQPGDHVLDICAAPGAKLCMIADLLGGVGSVTGVDVSRDRLATCRTLACKYRIPNCRLFLCDGTTFSAPPPSTAAAECVARAAGLRLTREGSRPGAAPLYPPAGATSRQPLGQGAKRRRRAPEQVHSDQVAFFSSPAPDQEVVSEDACQAGTLYDRVLVDAECTHDGSIKHILKYDKWGWTTFERRFLDPDRIDSITQLQRKLLMNGIRLLRPGGRLVYSTCSLTRAQNEDVVASVTESLKGVVQVVPCALAGNDSWPCSPGSLEHTLKFDPVTSHTSGLFIACIEKLHSS